MKKTLLILSLTAALLLSGCGAGAERDSARPAAKSIPGQSEPKDASTGTKREARPDKSAVRRNSSKDGTSQADPGKKQNRPEEKTEKKEKPVPTDDELVRVREYIPDIVVDLKYATEDNFTGTVIYNFSEAYLRYGTVKKLKKVQEEVKKDGFSLKIWDAYRPVSAQFRLWEVCPDDRYVANPNGGYSSHSRGNTVDITLSDWTGNEVEMPTGFDSFTAKADRDYSDCAEIEREHVTYLEQHMVARGFDPYVSEWWHFADVVDYPIAERIPRKSSK